MIGFIKRHWANIVFGVMLLLFLIYAGIFIYQSSVVVGGQRYFILFDDAMISMQYARNLAHGNGLVWIAGGPRVEGITNPLWTIYMAFFHLFPIPTSTISICLQISGAIFLLLNLYFVKKITELLTDNNQILVLLAVILCAFYYPLNQWALLGLEVSILTMITSLVTWRVLKNLKEGKFSIWIYLMLGVSTLVRMDMLVLGLATLGFLVIVDAPNRKKHLLIGTLVLVGFMAGQTLARYLYYGDVLPNTYYLKMTGSPLLLRLARGASVFFKFVWNGNIVLMLFPLMVFLFRRDKATFYLLLAFLAQVAYSIYIGGDAWEHRGGSNRFFSNAMPLFFILFILCCEKLRQAIVKQVSADGASLKLERMRSFSYLGVAVFVFYSLVSFNTLLDTTSLQYAFLQKPSIYTVGEEKSVTIAQFINDTTTSNATVAIHAAGIIEYLTDREAFDVLGKSDKLIAHEPMHIPPDQPLIDFRPGHNKWDYAYTIGVLKPDVIIEVFDGTIADAYPYLADYRCIEPVTLKRRLSYGAMFVRTDSPNFFWDKKSLYNIATCPTPSSN